jgi:hypothetical protein
LNESIDWIFELKDTVPLFLERLKGERRGFFKYSLTGDLYSEKQNWGLGNAVFATKIYYTLNKIESLPKEDIQNLIDFIKTFQKKDGSIYDPLITRKASFETRIQALKKMDFSDFFLRTKTRRAKSQTRRSESRQSFSALRLLNSNPDIPYHKIPQTTDGVDDYLSKLDWAQPWGAGAHFSHLLFFLKNSADFFAFDRDLADELIAHSINSINQLQSPEDGAWYKGSDVPLFQKINGAMKVITGLEAANSLKFAYPERLLDLCLSTPDLDNACNILDVVYVIRHANALAGGNYRYEDIRDFCYRWLAVCNEHYFPEIGGFSFLKHQANQCYGETMITKGRCEPDIHGSVLLLWGIALISNILGFSNQLQFQEFVT